MDFAMQVYQISEDALDPLVLDQLIYPDLENCNYWSDDWSVSFYTASVLAGTIPVTYHDNSMGNLLVLNLHDRYSVLDWENLHISTKVQKMIRRGEFSVGKYTLRISTDIQRAVDGISASYGDNNWVIPQYAALLEAVQRAQSRIIFTAVELIDNETGTVLGGELGYTIGTVYTSLSGFTNRDFPNIGTVQLVVLGKVLEQKGYSFWNLGQPYMTYKAQLGAIYTPRSQFIERWKELALGDISIGDLVGEYDPAVFFLDY